MLVEVSGEPGQVVETGQAVATLARDGEREIEVFFPDAARPPAAGQLVRADGAPVAAALARGLRCGRSAKPHLAGALFGLDGEVMRWRSVRWCVPPLPRRGATLRR